MDFDLQDVKDELNGLMDSLDDSVIADETERLGVYDAIHAAWLLTDPATYTTDEETDAAWDFPGSRGHLDADGKLSDPYDKDPETVDPVRGRATSWTASDRDASTAPAEPENER